MAKFERIFTKDDPAWLYTFNPAWWTNEFKVRAYPCWDYLKYADQYASDKREFRYLDANHNTQSIVVYAYPATPIAYHSVLRLWLPEQDDARALDILRGERLLMITDRIQKLAKSLTKLKKEQDEWRTGRVKILEP